MNYIGNSYQFLRVSTPSADPLSDSFHAQDLAVLYRIHSIHFVSKTTIFANGLLYPMAHQEQGGK